MDFTKRVGGNRKPPAFSCWGSIVPGRSHYIHSSAAWVVATRRNFHSSPDGHKSDADGGLANQLTGGWIETQFHVIVSLGIPAFFPDLRVFPTRPLVVSC